MALDIACGLCYLHCRRPSYLIHRDVKPNNFLLTADLRVKISDFGICKVLQNREAKRSQDNMNRAGALKYLTSLTTLDLARNYIGAGGACSRAAVADPPQSVLIELDRRTNSLCHFFSMRSRSAEKSSADAHDFIHDLH